MKSERPQKPKRIRPINMGPNGRLMYAEGSDDTDVLMLDRTDVPLRGKKPTSDSERAGLDDTSKRVMWSNEKITLENY